MPQDFIQHPFVFRSWLEFVLVALAHAHLTMLSLCTLYWRLWASIECLVIPLLTFPAAQATSSFASSSRSMRTRVVSASAAPTAASSSCVTGATDGATRGATM